MSNLPVIPETAPDYMKALLQSNPELAAVNDAAIASIGGGFPPYIGIKQGRFVVKDGDTETVLESLFIDVLVLRGKETFSKKYYASAYKPGQEAQAPDCFSHDGIKPDPAAKNKQCDSCAGCAMNQFKTAVRQDGTLGEGKACADVKTLAIYANKGIYGFNVPPDSLKNFRTHVTELSKRNMALPAVITRISFDTNSDTTKLLFNYAGVMPPEKMGAVVELVNDSKTLEIINPKGGMTALPAPVEQKALPQAEPEKPKAGKPKAEKSNAAKATEQIDNDPLGLSAALGGATTSMQTEPADEDLASALGL